ncbi:MAG: hypothetical protein E6R04_03175 [Spirochaetes bacterium]|nr:MAG: hypothetical protein E6R04_03175 [Spirochaetota bacterium]
MSVSLYDHAAIEEYLTFMTQELAHQEEVAQNMLTHSGVLADNTRGSAADAHAETSHQANLISLKGQEVIQQIHDATHSAHEGAQTTDLTSMQALTAGF